MIDEAEFSRCCVTKTPKFNCTDLTAGTTNTIGCIFKIVIIVTLRLLVYVYDNIIKRNNAK